MKITRLTRAVLWMIGALISFSIMAVSIRGLAARGLSIFEILAIRSMIALIIIGALALVSPQLRAAMRPRRLKLHFLRNTIHYLSQYFWALSVTLLPLALVFSLEFTMPAWTAVLAAWLLKERLSPSRIGVIVLGVVGVVVILRPGLAGFNPAALIVLAVAFAYSIVNIATKKLSDTEPASAIIFWMSVIQLPLSLIGSNLSTFLHLNAGHILPALGLGLAGTSSHYCLSKAFQEGDATVVVPIDFMRIPLIAVVGWAFFNESLDIFVLLGASIIIVGMVWNLRAEANQATATSLQVSE